MKWLGAWVSRVVVLGLALSAGAALAETDPNKISDSDRAKRDAEKVYSFIKFSTVRSPNAAPAAPKPAPAPAPVTAAARPAPAPAPAVTTRSLVPASTQVAQASQASTLASDQPGRVLEPAAPLPSAPAETAPTTANTLPAPAPEPEPEVEEVPLRLVHYVEPEMNRLTIEAMEGRQTVVPVRFVVQPNGVVSSAEPREGKYNRRLGQLAARTIQKWRFAPLPAERVVDVELAFKPPAD